MATRRLLIYSTRSSSTSSIFTSPDNSWREIERESEREMERERESQREMEREGEGEGQIYRERGQIERDSGGCG